MRVKSSQREALKSTAAAAGAKVLWEDATSAVLELTDSEAQLNRFIALCGAHGEVLEVVRSGALAILRSDETLRA